MSKAVPTDWEVVNFGSVAKIQNGYAFKTEDFNDKGSIAVIRMSNLKSGRIDLSSAKFVALETVKNLENFKLKAGAFLFGMSGSIDNFGWISNEDGICYLNQRVGCIKALVDNDPKFVAYSFLSESFRKDILVLAAGAAQLNISATQVESIFVLRPPLPEQQKIASILTAVDDVIESTQAQINKLKDLKTGMMQELLTKGIGHTEFKDSPVGRIPKEWTTNTLSGCSLIKNNLRKPINKEERELMRGIYPYYGPTKAVDFINEFRVEGEHVLIGEDGDHFIKFATWAMTQFVAGKFNVNNHAHIIQGTDRCRTKWIYFYFMHRDITVALTRQGATRYKLNKASLEELELAIPDIGEQDQIISIFDALMEKLSLQEQKILKLNGIKKSLMQDLLTGKVRVTVVQ